MLSEFEQVRIRKLNKKAMLQMMTNYHMDLAGIYDSIEVSAVKLAEDDVAEKIQSGTLNHLYQMRTA